MILQKIIPRKTLMLAWVVGLFTVGFFIFQTNQIAEAVNTCGFNSLKTGAFSVSSNCTISSQFGSGFEGVDSGDLTIASGRQIVIGSGSALVLSPSSQLIITKPSHPSGAIVFTDSSSQIVKGSLCAQDADADGYADKTPYSGQAEPVFFYATGNCPTTPVNYVKKGLLTSLTQLDCNSASGATQKIDCVKTRVNGEWSNVGTCGQYTPGIQVRTRTWTATVNTQPDCGGTACGSLSGTEDDYTLICGTCIPGATQTNYCGEGACASSQLVTCRADGTWPTDCTSGTAENDASFCSRLGKNCGSFTGVDNCLAARTANCGSCTLPQTCGGSGTANVCSCLDTTWTPATNAICTPATGGPATFTQTSNCGTQRQEVGTQVCCLTGYRDYDKDGYGTGASGCYVPTITYNIVANANDCNDSDSNIYPGRTVTTFCGVGSCGGSGTDTCDATGGTYTHTVPCTTSAAACCEANGSYKLADTGVNTCQKCTGSSATPVNQTSSEDLLNNCTSGAAGSATACKSNNCSGTGDSCGFVGAGTSCRASAGVCDSAETCTGSGFSCPIDSFLSNSTICNTGTFNTPASGFCQRVATDTKCSGSAAACNGSTVNRYDNAPTAGNVWNGTAWATASASVNCGLSGYLCSTQQIYQNFYGCNTSGTCDNVTSRGTTNGANCSGGENARCAVGSGSCFNGCSNSIDDDGDGYIDATDPDCGAVCTSGDCCNLATGQYKTAGTVIGTCKKCTGSSNTSVFQTSSEDLGGNCMTGAAGSATACQSNNCSGTTDSCGFVGAGTSCRASAGVCDSAETCTGSGFSCPIDSFLSNSTICNTGTFNTPASGFCQRVATDTKCSGSAAACNGATADRYDNGSVGQVWNGTAWATASASVNCGFSGYLCSGQQVYRNYFGCTGAGACSATVAGTSNGALCTGVESNRCVAGSSSCQNNCGNGLDDDSDGFTDALDTDCGAVCTSGDCCNLATGQYKTAGTVIGTCKKCTGSSNTSVFQTSSEDLGGNCMTGAAGSATACQSNNCSGTTDSCGFVGAGTSCRASAGVCDSAETCTGSAFTCPIDSFLSNSTICDTGAFNNPASGSCQRTAVDTKCSGSAAACNGATANRYDNGSANQVWSGTSWVASSVSTNCNLSGYLCSGQQIYRSYYGCDGSGSCSGTAAGTSNGTLCSGEGTTNKCIAGNATCQTNCADGLDNDGDGYTDTQDAGCGGSEQCTSGDCCNTTTGAFKAINTVIGTCKKCTGSSATSVNQTSSEDLGNNCSSVNGACQLGNCSGSGDYCGYVGAGTTCRASAGVCDAAETCTGSGYSCPIDSKYSTSYVCSSGSFNSPASGSCQRTATDQYCNGTADTCTGTTGTRYDNGSTNQVWNGSAWAAASASVNCNMSGYLCSGQQIYRNYYGCNGSGSCSGTAAGTSNGSLCSGEGTANKCVAGNSTCQSNCTDSLDNDGDGYTDALDTDCGAVCTWGDCCNTATGQYKAANTVIGTCMKCTGSSNTSVAQTSSQDLGGNCSTGAAGSATSCQSNNCSGSGDSCGALASGTTCRALGGPCDVTPETCNGSSYSCPADSFQNTSYVCSTGSCSAPASGACSSTATDQYCSGSSPLCNGASVPRNCNAPSGQVGNGSTWVAASASVNCNMSGYLCSGQQIYRNYYGCNGSGSCSGTAAGTSNGSLCSGGENSRCVAGQSSCQSFCSGGADEDGDGYIDGQDTNCGGYGQCTSGDCCNTATGAYKPAGCLSGCLKCTGNSTTSVVQGAGEDLCNYCPESPAGPCEATTCDGTYNFCGALSNSTTCRASAGVCDPAEKCTGGSGSHDCPVDSYYGNTVVCSTGSFNSPAAGSCQRTATDQKCSGSSAACNGATVNRYENAPVASLVWNGSAWNNVTSSNYCGTSAWACSGKQNYYSFYGCNTSGSCNTSSSAGTVNGTLCDACQNCTTPNSCTTIQYTGYRDYDKDSYGTPGYGTYYCSSGYDVVANGNDCNDSNALVTTPTFTDDFTFCRCQNLCGGTQWTQYDFSCTPTQTKVTTCSYGCPSGYITNCWVPRLQGATFSGACSGGSCVMGATENLGDCSTNYCWGTSGWMEP